MADEAYFTSKSSEDMEQEVDQQEVYVIGPAL
jgi:hypothetical protein